MTRRTAKPKYRKCSYKGPDDHGNEFECNREVKEGETICQPCKNLKHRLEVKQKQRESLAGH